jgi:hypothetical protein
MLSTSTGSNCHGQGSGTGRTEKAPAWTEDEQYTRSAGTTKDFRANVGVSTLTTLCNVLTFLPIDMVCTHNDELPTTLTFSRWVVPYSAILQILRRDYF